jgi:hypothetical protein
MDRELFLRACGEVCADKKRDSGIGVLGEKTLHAVIKRYLEPYDGSREVKIGRLYADIVGEDGIFEIQTRDFYRLRKKLDAFLPICRVTVVYPVAARKHISWIDPATGEVTKRRKSPKTGGPCEVFPELYKIKSYLKHENFRLCVMLIDMEEYRILNGWSADKKKGSERHERIPLALADELYYESPADYISLVPAELPGKFTVVDFKKAAGLGTKAAGTALNVLAYLGVFARAGKDGRKYLYERAMP